MKKTTLLIACIFLIIFYTLGCVKKNEVPKSLQVRASMHNVYASIVSLHEYMWSPDKFLAKESEDAINKHLESLIANFKHVDLISDTFPEPGLDIILSVIQRQLHDIQNKFRAGKKEYALWRLHGISDNCIACHSRRSVSTEFIGHTPVVVNESYESHLAASRFLFATRQFAEASKSLLDTIDYAIAEEGYPEEIRQALKLWLIIEVRVKHRPNYALSQLQKLKAKEGFPESLIETTTAWERGLKEVSNLEISEGNELEIAEKLLNPLNLTQTFEDQEKRFIQTLKATELLHVIADGIYPSGLRRKSLYLLGLAYSRFPVVSFDVYQELYLERCIHEYPGSAEAQEAYHLYVELLETTHSGSEGLQLEDSEKEYLEVLKELAFRKFP